MGWRAGAPAGRPGWDGRGWGAAGRSEGGDGEDAGNAEEAGKAKDAEDAGATAPPSRPALPPARPWDAWVTPRPAAPPQPSGPAAPTAPPSAEGWSSPSDAPTAPTAPRSVPAADDGDEAEQGRTEPPDEAASVDDSGVGRSVGADVSSPDVSPPAREAAGDVGVRPPRGGLPQVGEVASADGEARPEGFSAYPEPGRTAPGEAGAAGDVAPGAASGRSVRGGGAVAPGTGEDGAAQRLPASQAAAGAAEPAAGDEGLDAAAGPEPVTGGRAPASREPCADEPETGGVADGGAEPEYEEGAAPGGTAGEGEPSGPGESGVEAAPGLPRLPVRPTGARAAGGPRTAPPGTGGADERLEPSPEIGPGAGGSGPGGGWSRPSGPGADAEPPSSSPDRVSAPGGADERREQPREFAQPDPEGEGDGQAAASTSDVVDPRVEPGADGERPPRRPESAPDTAEADGGEAQEDGAGIAGSGGLPHQAVPFGEPRSAPLVPEGGEPPSAPEGLSAGASSAGSDDTVRLAPGRWDAGAPGSGDPRPGGEARPHGAAPAARPSRAAEQERPGEAAPGIPRQAPSLFTAGPVEPAPGPRAGRPYEAPPGFGPPPSTDGTAESDAGPEGTDAGAERPGERGEWGATAFGEGEVRWAPELPPGWVAAGREGAEPREEPPGAVGVVGDGPPTYAPEPTAWPEADPDALDGQVPDTVLDGAQYGPITLRAAAVRGDSARYRGQPRRDALLTARFGSGDDALLLVAMATGARGADDAHRAARDAVRWIAGAVGRSRARLSDDLRAARRGSLKSGLHRLTDRCYGRLRARGEDLGLDAGSYTAAVRCLLLPVDPECRIRLFFGVGDGGLFRLRDGGWQDLDPGVAPTPGAPVAGPYGAGRPPAEPYAGPFGQAGPEGHGGGTYGTGAPFRFRATLARPGDALLMCGAGLAEPVRGEPELAQLLAGRWGTGRVPGMAAYLADVQTRVKGYADDRTAVTVWDA